MQLALKRHSVLPGFGLTLGYSLFYLALIVLIPLAALFLKAASITPREFWEITTSPAVVASYKLTFGTALIGAMVNVVFGFVVAWTITRYKFFGRKLIDSLVDLPFALPTAVSGIALATIYGPRGMVGSLLLPYGIKTAFSPLGIAIAMSFIGLPFVVRTLQPALEELDAESEEASASLGATRWQTFWRVILPTVSPALLTGFSLAFARALGEYGSVVFIAGNLPGKTEITSLIIMQKLDETDGIPAATAVAAVMLVASFLILLAINLLQWWTGRAALKGA